MRPRTERDLPTTGPGARHDRIPAARVGEDARLDGDEAETWRVLAAVLVRLPAALDAQLHRDAGMTFLEYQILAALARAPDGAVRMGTLARSVHASPSKLSRGMARLEVKDCVDRTADPVERRYTLGRITARGRDVVRAAAPAHEAAVRRWVFDRLDDAQVRALRDVGEAIHDAVDDVPEA